jgi:hypothetical protein
MRHMAALLTATVLVALGLVVRPLPASAAELVAPDAQGAYAVCNIRLNRWTNYSPYNSGAPFRFWLSCNYSLAHTNGDPDISGSLNGLYSVTDGSAGQHPCNTTGSGQTVTVNGLGRYRCEYTTGTFSSSETRSYGETQSFCYGLTFANGGTNTLTRQCRYHQKSTGQGYPEYPPDWYSGGSPPDQNVATSGLTCGRTLASPSEMAARFTATSDPVPNTTVSWSWAFGDGSSSSVQNPSKVYPALTQMPSGGWTATVTATYTGQPGYVPDPSTRTCSLKVDFLNPNDLDPSTAGDDDDEGGDCPSGWGWLNPLAILKVLRCAFVPTGNPFEGISEAYDTSGVSIITFPLEMVDDAITALQKGANSAMDDPGEPGYECEGPTASFRLPGTSTEFEVAPLTTCEAPFSTVASVVRPVTKVALWLMAILGSVRMVAGTFGVQIGRGG